MYICHADASTMCKADLCLCLSFIENLLVTEHYSDMLILLIQIFFVGKNYNCFAEFPAL